MAVTFLRKPDSAVFQSLEPVSKTFSKHWKSIFVLSKAVLVRVIVLELINFVLWVVRIGFLSTSTKWGAVGGGVDPAKPEEWPRYCISAEGRLFPTRRVDFRWRQIAAPNSSKNPCQSSFPCYIAPLNCVPARLASANSDRLKRVFYHLR